MLLTGFWGSAKVKPQVVYYSQLTINRNGSPCWSYRSAELWLVSSRHAGRLEIGDDGELLHLQSSQARLATFGLGCHVELGACCILDGLSSTLSSDPEWR